MHIYDEKGTCPEYSFASTIHPLKSSVVQAAVHNCITSGSLFPQPNDTANEVLPPHWPGQTRSFRSLLMSSKSVPHHGPLTLTLVCDSPPLHGLDLYLHWRTTWAAAMILLMDRPFSDPMALSLAHEAFEPAFRYPSLFILAKRVVAVQSRRHRLILHIRSVWPQCQEKIKPSGQPNPKNSPP